MKHTLIKSKKTKPPAFKSGFNNTITAFCCLFLFSLISLSTVQAQAIWEGDTSSDFDDKFNWNGDTLPANYYTGFAGQTLIIKENAPNLPVINPVTVPIINIGKLEVKSNFNIPSGVTIISTGGSDGVVIDDNMTFTIDLGGKLIIQNAIANSIDVEGILVVNDSLFINSTIGSSDALNIAFGATVNINSTGVVCIGNIDDDAIVNGGTVTNEGTIFIYNVEGSGILNNGTANFDNNGNIYINDVGEEGVFNNGGTFNNNDGDSLKIYQVVMNGIRHGGVDFTNRGIITIDNVGMDGFFASEGIVSDGDTILIGTNQPLTGSGSGKGSTSAALINGIGGDGFDIRSTYTIANNSLITVGDSVNANVAGSGFNLSGAGRVDISTPTSVMDASKINIHGVSGDGILLSTTANRFNSYDGTTVCISNVTDNGIENFGVFRNENSLLKIDGAGEAGIENLNTDAPGTLTNLEGGVIEIGFNGGNITTGININEGVINNGVVGVDDTGTAIRINSSGIGIMNTNGNITNGDGTDTGECVLLESNAPTVQPSGTIINHDIHRITATDLSTVHLNSIINNGIVIDIDNSYNSTTTSPKAPGTAFSAAGLGVIVGPVSVACFSSSISDFLISHSSPDLSALPYLPSAILLDDITGGQIGTFDASTNTATLDMAASNMRLRFDIISGGTTCGEQGLVMVDFASITTNAVVCNSNIQMSLDANCIAVIDPNHMLEGTAVACTDGFVVEILSGSRAGQDTLDATYLGETVMVKVTGPNGNSCWGSITIEDKLPPTLTCQDTIVYCAQNTAPELLGFPTATDACGGTVTFTYVDQEQTFESCGQVAADQDTLHLITRLFTAYDQFGNSDTCTQRIRVLRPTIGQIEFPDSLTGTTALSCEAGTTGTGVSPDITGRPFFVNGSDTIVINSLCKFGISYSDEVNSLGCAGKNRIMRTWTLMDWCHLTTGGGVRVYQQLIDIIDTLPPTFTPFPDTVEVVTTLDVNKVTIVTNNEHKCMADIRVPQLVGATDNCSGVRFRVLGPTGTIFNEQNDTLFNVPLGTHTLEYIIADSCGNEVRDTVTFILRDTESPTIIANNNVQVVLNNATSTWVPAAVFDAGSTDNCELDSFLMRKTDNDIFADKVAFTCEDRVLDSVQIKLIDTTGNASIAWVQIEIIDKNGFCTPLTEIDTGGDIDENGTDKESDETDGDGVNTETDDSSADETDTNDDNTDINSTPTANIAGQIQNENGDRVESVSITIGGYEMAPELTGATGTFMFEEIPLEGNYQIIPDKDMNYANGVSTYDIVLLSKHVLGLNYLDSPYKMIAADINNSGSITAYDMVLLRQLILGIKDDFANNTSWRFIDAAYEFVNATNPFEEDYPEAYEIQNLSADMMTLDFVAVKIGDLNESAVANQLMTTENRNTNQSLNFTIEEQIKQAGEVITVPIKSSNFKDILGYQFTLDFDGHALDFETIQIGKHAGFENFNLSMVQRGIITSSWSQAEATTITSDEIIFSLVFKVKKDLQLSDVLHLGSAITQAEAYNENEERLNVNLDIKDAGANIAGFKLYQNKPNPFTGETLIGFDLPNASAVTLTILDMSGKVIREVKGEYTEGYNQILIDGKEFDEQGMFYYRLATKKGIETKKMILLKR